MLLMGNKLICTPGGTGASVAALDRNTGKTIWTCKAGTEKSGYCSPVLMKHGKGQLLVTMLGASIIGMVPSSGKLLWQHPHTTKHGVNANTPLYHNGNIIYVSGYNQGVGMLKLSADGKQVTQAWRDTLFDVQMGGAILHDGYLYGSGHRNKGFKIFDTNSGTVAHSDSTIGTGCVIMADGLLYCYSDKGTMSLVKPTPQKCSVLSSFKVTKGEGPHWAHPVIHNGKLYVRHGQMLMVYRIKA
jgi:outer membrane protein assembly factor BamB